MNIVHLKLSILNKKICIYLYEISFYSFHTTWILSENKLAASAPQKNLPLEKPAICLYELPAAPTVPEAMSGKIYIDLQHSQRSWNKVSSPCKTAVTCSFAVTAWIQRYFCHCCGFLRLWVWGRDSKKIHGPFASSSSKALCVCLSPTHPSHRPGQVTLQPLQLLLLKLWPHVCM